MFEVTFRAKHECPYVKFSEKHPYVRMVQWCNRRIDVLEIECRDIEMFNRIGPDLQNLLLWKGEGAREELWGQEHSGDNQNVQGHPYRSEHQRCG